MLSSAADTMREGLAHIVIPAKAGISLFFERRPWKARRFQLSLK